LHGGHHLIGRRIHEHLNILERLPGGLAGGRRLRNGKRTERQGKAS